MGTDVSDLGTRGGEPGTGSWGDDVAGAERKKNGGEEDHLKGGGSKVDKQERKSGCSLGTSIPLTVFERGREKKTKGQPLETRMRRQVGFKRVVRFGKNIRGGAKMRPINERQELRSQQSVGRKKRGINF